MSKARMTNLTCNQALRDLEGFRKRENFYINFVHNHAKNVYHINDPSVEIGKVAKKGIFIVSKIDSLAGGVAANISDGKLVWSFPYAKHEWTLETSALRLSQKLGLALPFVYIEYSLFEYIILGVGEW